MIKTFLKHLLAAVLIAVALLVGAIVFLNVFTKHNQELTVPDLSNMTVEEAQVQAELHDMVINVTDSVYVKG